MMEYLGDRLVEKTLIGAPKVAAVKQKLLGKEEEEQEKTVDPKDIPTPPPVIKEEEQDQITDFIADSGKFLSSIQMEIDQFKDDTRKTLLDLNDKIEKLMALYEEEVEEDE